MSDDAEVLDRRVMELELRSEERREEILRLQAFVSAYESRIDALEAQVRSLGERLRNPAEAMPSAEDDRPPHY